MKQILSLFALGLLFSCFSCNNENETTAAAAKEENSAAKKNLDAFHVVTKAFDTGDPAMIDSVVASDFVDHTDKGDMGRDSLKAMIAAWKADSKDSKTEVIKEIADDDYVFGWLRFTGTSNGASGMKPGPYDMNSVEVVRFKDGKAVEHWAFMQPADMMKMMSSMPPPPPPAKK